jgi:hypothetical protein
MLKLLHSIFGGEKKAERYPESLIEAAIERTVEGTDRRLLALSGYKKQLRPSVIHAIDHVVGLVDGLPAPVAARRTDYSADPCLTALFASADHMLQVFGSGAVLNEFRGASVASSERVFALLLAERTEKNILGNDLVGGQVRRDVAQVTVNFGGHRLLEPATNEAHTRRHLKRRAFDHLLTLALTRITDTRGSRAELSRQRDLLRSKLRTLERSGWSFETQEGASPEPEALNAELQATELELANLGADSGALQASMDIVTDVLGHAEQQLWSSELILHLDRMNIQRDAQDASAQRIILQELHNARGVHLVMLLLSLAPGELPQREHFSTAAARYLT